MNMQDLSSLLIHLKAYQLDLDDRQRHAQQVNQEDKLTRNAINYLRARRNDAAQIISDIESEIAQRPHSRPKRTANHNPASLPRSHQWRKYDAI